MIVKKRAVMMEYVIIAVLIAAAVVVAVIMFGKNVSHEMNVATKSMSNAKGAENYQGELKKKSITVYYPIRNDTSEARRSTYEKNFG